MQHDIVYRSHTAAMNAPLVTIVSPKKRRHHSWTSSPIFDPAPKRAIARRLHRTHASNTAIASSLGMASRVSMFCNHALQGSASTRSKGTTCGRRNEAHISSLEASKACDIFKLSGFCEASDRVGDKDPSSSGKSVLEVTLGGGGFRNGWNSLADKMSPSAGARGSTTLACRTRETGISSSGKRPLTTATAVPTIFRICKQELMIHHARGAKFVLSLYMRNKFKILG